ncbi:hypothetical protein [Kitasatospora sp. NBC_00315]|uniref:hypothetical protein n=1 Tax=Kitasatospora sp. NBC_00315 TaxID=2975963 RepID=UPI0032535537
MDSTPCSKPGSTPGAVLHLARPTRIVARMREITGADHVFPVDQDDPGAASPRAN